jgi:hypothetical protein
MFLLVVTISFSAACGRQKTDTDNQFASLLTFDSASPDAREALTAVVDFPITDDNFGRWQEAQSNLDKLPRSAIRSSPAVGATAIDRAISRLQSNPSARRAIEGAGLSVRDFVLETIALAQATAVARTGVSAGMSQGLANNYAFVRRYGSRALRGETAETSPNSAGESFVTPVNPSEPAEPAEAAEPAEPDVRQLQERTPMVIDSALRDDPNRVRRKRDPIRDSLRDTLRDSLPNSLSSRS